MSVPPTVADLQQRAESALRRAIVLGPDEVLLRTREGVQTIRHRPSGEEFMLEVKVLPMGDADG